MPVTPPGASWVTLSSEDACCLLQPAGRPSQQGRPLGRTRSQNRGQMEAQSRAGLPEALLSGAWTSCLMPLPRTVLLPAAPSWGAVALGLLPFDRVTDLGGGPGRLPQAALWSVRGSSGFREGTQLRAAKVRAAGHFVHVLWGLFSEEFGRAGDPFFGAPGHPCSPGLPSHSGYIDKRRVVGEPVLSVTSRDAGSWERAGVWVPPGKPGSSQDGEPLSAERGSL